MSSTKNNFLDSEAIELLDHGNKCIIDQARCTSTATRTFAVFGVEFTCVAGRCSDTSGSVLPGKQDPGQRSLTVLGLPKVARHFSQRTGKCFLSVGSMVIFPVAPVKSLEVEDVEQSLADCVP